jgi:hypothetical protein
MTDVQAPFSTLGRTAAGEAESPREIGCKTRLVSFQVDPYRSSNIAHAEAESDAEKFGSPGHLILGSVIPSVGEKPIDRTVPGQTQAINPLVRDTDNTTK